MLSDIASSYVAKEMINYDMSGYTSREEAQTMLDVNDDVIRSILAFLKNFDSDEIKDVQ